MSSIKTGVLPVGQSLLPTDEWIGNIDDNDGPLVGDTSRTSIDLLRVFLEGAITTLNASGNINAATFSGDGSALTNLVSPGPGGSSSTGTLSMVANSAGGSPAAIHAFINNGVTFGSFEANGDFVVDTDGIFYDKSKGFIGFGLNNPDAAVDVSGLAGVSVEAIGTKFDVNKVVHAGQISIHGDANNSYFSHNVYLDGGVWKSSSGAAHGQIQMNTAGDTIFLHEATSVAGTTITWDEHMRIFANGGVEITSLAGTGTRNVVVDANGLLSAP